LPPQRETERPVAHRIDAGPYAAGPAGIGRLRSGSASCRRGGAGRCRSRVTPILTRRVLTQAPLPLSNGPPRSHRPSGALSGHHRGCWRGNPGPTNR
jgi:hypothetical protein